MCVGEKYSTITKYFPHAENLEILFCSTTFVDKIIRGNTICVLFYQLEVNMGKYLSQKGKARGNNEWRYLLRQIFPHINHKLIKLTILYISSDYFVNKMPLKLVIKKKYFQIFGIGKIFTVIGKYFPSFKLRHFLIHNISRNRYMK